MTEMKVYARDSKSVLTWLVLPLSDFDFSRLNKEIVGAPIYYNGDQIWPSPSDGISVSFQEGEYDKSSFREIEHET